MSNSQAMVRFVLIALVVMAVAGSATVAIVIFGNPLAAVVLAPAMVLLVALAMNWLLPTTFSGPR